MRFLIKASIPVEIGNAKAKDGSLGRDIQRIMEQQKPECAYFVEDDGERTGYMVVNMDSASDIPAIAEPWFLAFEANLTIRPAMVPEDLAAAAPDIEAAAKMFG